MGTNNNIYHADLNGGKYKIPFVKNIWLLD